MMNTAYFLLLVCCSIGNLGCMNTSAEQKKIQEATVQIPADINLELGKVAPDYEKLFNWAGAHSQRINFLLCAIVSSHHLNGPEAVAAVIKLIKLGGNVNEVCKGASLLMWAVRRKALALVNNLLVHGAKVNYQDSQGYTALYELLKRENFSSDDRMILFPIAKLLISYGADVNHRTNVVGNTPLLQVFLYMPLSDKSEEERRAIQSIRLEVARLLLENGADPEAAEANGRTVLDYAKRFGDSEAVKLVEEFIRKSYEAKVAGKELVAKGLPAPVAGIVREYIQTPVGREAILNQIKKAIRENDIHTLGYLILGKENLELADAQGYTPLLEAVYSNKPELVKLLVSQHADKNARLGIDKDGLNALELAWHIGEDDLSDAETKSNKEIIDLLRDKEISLTPAGAGLGLDS